MKPKAYRYEICIEEVLQGSSLDWFPSWEITAGVHTDENLARACTLLRGAVHDQAALFGVLATIRDLNLTLVSVRRLPDGQI